MDLFLANVNFWQLQQVGREICRFFRVGWGELPVALKSGSMPMHNGQDRTSKFQIVVQSLYQLSMGSWGLSTCVFASMQGCHAPKTTTMADLYACKCTCGQFPGAHVTELPLTPKPGCQMVLYIYCQLVLQKYWCNFYSRITILRCAWHIILSCQLHFFLSITSIRFPPKPSVKFHNRHVLNIFKVVWVCGLRHLSGARSARHSLRPQTTIWHHIWNLQGLFHFVWNSHRVLTSCFRE